MRLHKPLVISGALVTAGIAGLVTTQAVSAANDSSGQSLVDRIASTFNLNKSDVQKVFDEEHKSREAERQQKLEERVKQAVDDGKISQDLADQLIAKHKEMQTYRDSIKDKSADERRSLMKTKMDEMQKWLKDNNIDKSLFGPMGGRGFGGHGPDKAEPAN
jgi:2C-methyl-D-erythritol 2,4-cyclodiphosphate synthase